MHLMKVAHMDATWMLVLCFLLHAGFVIIGFVSSISLLLRHWGAIERYHLAPPSEDITTPLLQVSIEL